MISGLWTRPSNESILLATTCHDDKSPRRNQTTDNNRNPIQKARDVHDQLTLCFVTVDFCLESRDTRLQKELIRLVTEAPAPRLTNNVP